MKKLLAVLSVASLLTPTLAFAAYNDVTMTTDAKFDVGGIEVDVAGSSAVVASVVVNDTSMVFTLSPSSAFTISAPNLNRLFTDTVAGLSTDSCTATQSLMTYAAGVSETVTITPSSTIFCGNQPSGGSGSGSSNNPPPVTTSSGGGGGGGGGGSVATTVTTPSTTTTTTTTTSSSSGLTSEQVTAILNVLNSFGADNATIANVQAALNGTGGTTTTTTSSTSYSFARDLQMGSVGADVLALQQYLNAHGFTIAASGVGSPGHETTTFGSLTKAALIKFQKANNITPAAGYFGPKTRAVVNSNP